MLFEKYYRVIHDIANSKIQASQICSENIFQYGYEKDLFRVK